MQEIKDKSIGVILYYKFPRSIKYLILKHKKGHWAFAKGHKSKGETFLQTAKRELHEETGIDEVEFLSNKILLSESYVIQDKNKDRVRKTVDYFIAKAKTKKIIIDKKEITNYRWCTSKQAEKIITYQQSKKVLKKANRLITKKLIRLGG